VRLSNGVTVWKTPTNRLSAGDFVAACKPDHLVYFVLNVGDGDAQLVLLPDDGAGRQLLVVDVKDFHKTDALIETLAKVGLIAKRSDLVALVVATHPHADHIAGMGTFLTTYASFVDEVWEPAFYYASAGYRAMMKAIQTGALRHGQPTSGMTRWIGQVKLMALSPGINLRNRFDTYGVDVNNSSIALRIEFPGRRISERQPDGSYIRAPRQSLILGADAQTLSWAQVFIDYPQLGPDKSLVAQTLSKAQGVEPLASDVFKVPHHASKHGLNLELVEQISPSLSLISSVGGGGKYNFPHLVSMEALREGIEATVKSGAAHKSDYELGIHYTFGVDELDQPLGSIAVVLSPGGRTRELWRFGDTEAQPVDFSRARRVS
jgi:beta-lactamase superfamily II metal-dependent hydrolase